MKKMFIAISLLFSLTITSVNAVEVTVEAKITGLYVAYFSRAADQAGLDYWTKTADNVAKQGGDVSSVFKILSGGFATHPTFTTTYGHLNNEEFVEAIYRNSLGRDGDAEGIKYWTDLLDRDMIRSDMVATFVELSMVTDLTPANYPTLSSAELAAAQLRQDLITNKVTVALAFTNQLGTLSNVVDNQDPENDPAYIASIMIISGVTEDKSTVSFALDFLDWIKESSDPIVQITTDESMRSGYFAYLELIGGQMFIDKPSIVNIVFTVVDENGNGVVDLEEDDFAISENGEAISERESFYNIVKHDAKFEENVLFLLDVSTSISFAQLDTMKQALKEYVYNADSNSSNLRTNTKVAIKTFAETTNNIINYTSDVNALLKAIDTITRKEPTTDLYGAYINGINALINNYTYDKLQHGTLILMSDGKDQAGFRTLDDALNYKHDNSIFVIHVASDEADRSVSGQLANNNKIYDINNFSEVTQALDSFNLYLEELSNSVYYLRYATPKRAGSHEVSVSAGNATLTGTFNADGFSSVTPELYIVGLDQNASLDKSKQHTINADMLWTLQEDIDAETFTWSSSDSSILNIVKTDNGEATIEFLANGEATITLDASLHQITTSITLSNMPTLAGSYSTPSDTRGVTVSGNYAYVADGYYGFRIIDISDPSSPVVTGRYNTSGTAHGVTISGNYAYVADGSYGLEIIDISDPASPSLIGRYDTPGTAYGVTIVGDYAYVADGRSGFQIIDISNSNSPLLVGTYGTTGTVFGITVAGDYAYVADYNSGLHIVDISDPASPVLSARYNTSSAPYGVTISGDYAYVANNNSGLHIVDISDPASPVPSASYDTSGTAHDVTIAGDYAYVADYSSGLQIIDVSDPASPALIGSYDTPGTAYGVTISGNYAYVADSNYGVSVLNISTDYFKVVPAP